MKQNTHDALRIIQDTREQSPFKWQSQQYSNFVVGVDTLSCGDYTLAGYDLPGDDHSVIVERKKDCRELCTNLVANWETFQAELQKMKAYRHKYIVVCQSYNFPWLYEQCMTVVSPNLIVKRIVQIQMDYGIQVLFLDSRASAERFVFQTFVEVMRRNRDDSNVC